MPHQFLLHLLGAPVSSSHERYVWRERVPTDLPSFPASTLRVSWMNRFPFAVGSPCSTTARRRTARRTRDHAAPEGRRCRFLDLGRVSVGSSSGWQDPSFCGGMACLLQTRTSWSGRVQRDIVLEYSVLTSSTRRSQSCADEELMLFKIEVVPLKRRGSRSREDLDNVCFHQGSFPDSQHKCCLKRSRTCS